MYTQTLSVLFTHSRVAFVVLLVAAVLSSGLFWVSPRTGAREGADPSVFAALSVGLLLCTWLFAFGVLLGAAASRLEDRIASWRVPLGGEVLRRCTVGWASILVALALVPALIRLSPAQAIWLVPCLAGAYASFLIAGLFITLVEMRRSVGLLGSLGFVALLMTWPRFVQGWSDTLSQASPSLQFGLATSGLFLLGLCGLVASRWVRVSRSAYGNGNALSPAEPMPIAGSASYARRSRARLWEGVGTPDANQLHGLIMPAPPALTRHEWLSAFGSALLFGAVTYVMPWNTDARLVFLAVWVTLAAAGGAVFVRGPWISPRVLLLPGGLQREGIAAQLFWLVLRRSLLRCLAMATPTMAALVWVTPLSALHMGALALAIPGCVVLGSAIAVDGLRRGKVWHSLALVAPLLPLALSATAAYAFAWVTAKGPIGAWFAWSLASSLSCAGIGALWLAVMAQRLQQLDAGHLPLLSNALEM